MPMMKRKTISTVMFGAKAAAIEANPKISRLAW
jgi:hypothetical protein